MPTPISAARQCLTPEAATALDEAVAVAKRRGHAQTTSLHVVSALLSFPSSSLREACARSRNAAYSQRLQFKALELCLSVSLDRVPSSQLVDDPPVSNSFMAAIKRSQANQRRQPENFYLYNQMAAQCSSSSLTSPSSINSLIKVELQHLILSILDDPVVSRVFGEAGFRSTEIKLSIVRPLPYLFRVGRPRGGPPLFLPDRPEFGLGGWRGLGFNFPFSVFPGFSDVDENCRRIGELLVRSKGRNPLLVGVSAIDALRSFVESVKSKKEGCLPRELSGLSAVSIEDDLSKLVHEVKVDEARLDSVFDEVRDTVRQCSESGLLVNFGDLKGFVSDQANSDVVNLMVVRMARLLEANGRKLWLIGSAASYDTYSTFLSRFPLSEKELDLQILPITTQRPSLAESCPRSSLMESFVPFAGFFSTSSELSIPVSGISYQCVSPQDAHSKKRKQETVHVSRGGTTTPVADQYQCSLPSWLHLAELGSKSVSATNKDNGLTATASPQQIESQSATESSLDGCNLIFSKTDSCQYGMGTRSIGSSMYAEPRKVITSHHVVEAPQFPKTKQDNFLSKHLEKPLNVECIDDPLVFKSPNLSGCNSSTDNGSLTSPASATSVPTSLGLGAAYTSVAAGLYVRGNQTVCGSLLGSNSYWPYPDINVKDFKMLYGELIKKLGRQPEAVRSISKALCGARSKTRFKIDFRGDLWFTFLGGDKIGKRRIAIALSDILRKHLIYVDLCPQGGTRCDGVIFSENVKNYDCKYRGKTTVDVIAGELGKNPCSIIFLENVEKADEQVQSNLSQGFESGKFSDSYGREVSLKNAVVIAASDVVRVGGVLSAMEFERYSEDRVLGVKCWQMKILVERASVEEDNDSHGLVSCKSKTPLYKRKLGGSNENVVLLETSKGLDRAIPDIHRGLDLNLPAEGEETDDGDAIYDDTIRWLSEFLDRMDVNVSFKPYDLDSLADNIFEGIKDSFRRLVGSDCSLEVDTKVIDQLVLAGYISDSENTWEEWLKHVLNREFKAVGNIFQVWKTPAMVKLVTSGDLLTEDESFVGHLPSKIIIESYHQE